MDVGAIRSLVPAQPTSLIGRNAELARIRESVLGGETRLLTLTGPPGVGKTRLAVAAAADLADHFADGIVFVDLTPVRDPASVLSSLAGALGLPDIRDRKFLGRLRDVLAEQRLLLVLDNFEQVLPAATSLADLLGKTEDLRMLVTSRVPLQLRWEQTMRIAPLPVPDLAMPLPSLEDLKAFPSIALFVQRARARQADFALTEQQAPLVARLVAHLDGLPLALELAAARTATLSLPVMASRLGDQLHLFHWNAPDIPKRQQSLEAALGWSYDMLSEPEKRMFRCLGVFRHRVTLDAFTAVYGEVSGKAETQDAAGALDGLVSLAEQSLIQPAPSTDPNWHQAWYETEEADDEAEPVFRVLETVRKYAEARLVCGGERETARRAHAAYFLALAERAEPHLHDHAQRNWLLTLEREHDNLRSALRWLLDQEAPMDQAAALRLAAALGYFWQVRGYHAEGWRWLGEAFTRAPQGEGTDPAVRTRAILQLGLLDACLGRLDRARDLLEEALSLARQQQDPVGMVQALIYRGACPLFAGQSFAVPLLKEALGHARALREPDHVGLTLYYLGLALQLLDKVDPALANLTEALDKLEDAGDARIAGSVHLQLGAMLGQHHDRQGGLRHLRAGLEICMSLQSRWLLSQAASAVLAVMGDHVNPVARARLLGAIEALKHALGAGGSAWEHLVTGPAGAELDARFEQEEWAAYREGVMLPAGKVASLTWTMLEEFAESMPAASSVSASALSHDRGRTQAGIHGRESPGGHHLTDRECEVLRLVEDGLSNKEIARQMSISSRTVSQHLTSVFNKLGVNTRAQAVAVATRHELV